VKNNLGIEEFWGPVDFGINKAFWEKRGHDAALPFRIMNLVDLTSALLEGNVNCFLFGSTLRSVSNVGVLVSDHDDDIFAFSSQREIEDLLARASPVSPASKFTVIRSTPKMVSVERYGRYIDIHFERLFEDIGFSMTRVHGAQIPLPIDVDRVLAGHDARKRAQIPLPIDVDRVLAGHDARKRAQRSSVRRNFLMLLTRGIKAGPKKIFEYLLRRTLGAVSGTTRSVPRTPKPRFLSLSEFCELQIDSPDAVNWQVRGPHWHAVFSPGETFGDALSRLRETELPESVTPDTQHSFDEPMNLSRRFWKTGNNSLLAPLRYGYRHAVVPYMAANLYINRNIEPSLYSDEYFESLPSMTDAEIYSFLLRNPISVISGSLTSGRHRATAMLGRLLRGEPYIPVAYQEEG
jgi:hypothetical protein